MKKVLLIIVGVLFALHSQADSIKYTVIFDGVEEARDLEQDLYFRACCSVVDPAWEIFVSKDSNSFNGLLLKVLRNEYNLEEDDPIRVLIQYIGSNIEYYFRYSDSNNRTYMGGNIEMPEKILLDIAHKYNLPSELEGAAFAREARRAAFVKNNEKEVMEKLLEVVRHLDINDFISIKSEKPLIRMITAKGDFAEYICRSGDFDSYILEQSEQIAKRPNGQIDQSMKQKVLSWYNNSSGKYLVTLSYHFCPNADSGNVPLYHAVSRTLKSLDVGGNNYLGICSQTYSEHERIGFYSNRESIDKWCFRLLTILYEKFNSFVVSDNLGHDSRICIVGRIFADCAEQSRISAQHNLTLLANSSFIKGEIYQGTDIFSPFGVVLRNPGMYNYYDERNYRQLNINDDMKCEVGFLLSESEIEKYTSFEGHFKK